MSQWYEFEFVVMCIGKYGDVPNMPEFPRGKGPEVFQGKVMHSLDYCKLDEEAAETLMKDKKVVVIGYKKSAIDLAVECAAVNRGKSTDQISIQPKILWSNSLYIYISLESLNIYNLIEHINI